MVTEENLAMPRIMMAPPETNLSYIQKHEKYNYSVQADVKKKKLLSEYKNINSDDSKEKVNN